MARSALLVLIAVTSLFGACTHSEEQTFAFESQIQPRGALRVTGFAGAITLHRDAVGTTVRGTYTVRTMGFDSTKAARDAARRVTLAEAGDASVMDLAVVLPSNATISRYAVDLDLAVPAGVVVSADNEVGPVLIDGLPVADVTTSDGQVDLVATRGDAVIRTSNAAVTAEDHLGALDVRTSNGQLDLVRVVGDVRGTTSNGFVYCEAEPPYAGEVVLATTNAGVEVRLPFDFGAELAALTSPESTVFIQGLDFYPVYDVPGQLEGDLGDGAGLVDVRTTNGDVVFRSFR
ncbi:MAG: hypothetical protein H6745_09320 [Deltaproteobacteria bacterium]|nr:hypothetical protein [Deltaproteobacteria bacterium]